MNAENRLKLVEICTRYFANGTDEQVEILRFYVGLGLTGLQKLEAENKARQENKEPPKPKKKGTTIK